MAIEPVPDANASDVLPTPERGREGHAMARTQAPGSAGLTDNFDTLAGQCIHRAIGVLAAQRPLPKGQHSRLIAILRAADAGCAGHLNNTARGRALRQAVATGVGVYASRFMLDEAWALVGAELWRPGCRIDLVFQHRDGTLIFDEIKRGMSRNGHVAVRAQVARYQAAGVEHWGTRFAGVRLLWLASPQLSQFYGTGHRNGRLLSEVADDRLRGER